ncbi:efflux transporter outer membrane subunit [Tolumonas lignilytica]|jgi:efflux transporter, outer membrane factor (OMF) lipoprotein, NodT family|uniref:efflux transporter outer membrane subunit n=1 Tax=Tolumonas lignilytica TaxID=1283284 RepID=UPI000463D517|nr:efflux transporter outer membrane subunit [Tolumonas lignilytica]
MIKRPLAFIVPLLLAGCSMAPDYQRPAAPIPANYVVNTNEIAKETGWKDVFTDPALQQLIDLALKNNRDQRIAVLNVEAYRAQYQIQRAAEFPTLTADGYQSRQRIPTAYSGAAPKISSTDSATVGISAYELDLFGRVKSLKDKALETYLAQEETQRSTQLTIIANVASAYLTLLADQDLFRLAGETAKSYEQSYQLTDQRYQAGISSSLELSQSRSNLESVRANLAQYRRQVAIDRNALQLLLGTNIPSGLSTGLPDQDLMLLTPLGAGIPSTLLTRRPDILAAEHALKASNANIGAARAAFFPTLSLTASAGSMSSSLSSLFNGNSGTWAFQPNISLPIFDFGSRSAQLDAAKVAKQIEVATYEKAIQTAFKEVSDGLVAQDGYREQLQAQQALVDANKTYYQLAQSRYEKGVDSYLTLLDAQRSLFSAEQGLVSTRLALLSNRVGLFKALGGGWQSKM